MGSLNTTDYARGIYVSGDFAYLAAQSAGLQIINISNKSQPFLEKSYQTNGKVYQVIVNNNYAYLSSSVSHLHIIDVSYPFKKELAPTGKDFQINLQIKDSNGNFSNEIRHVWVVAYNHPPRIENINIFKEGSIYKAQVTASDLDISKSWDGILEYRCDFENDGIWNTKFISQNTIELGNNINNQDIVCEVQDRYGARDTKIINIKTQEKNFPQGWNMISLPAEPISTDPKEVFKDQAGNAIPISGNLHRFDQASGGYKTYMDNNQGVFGQLKQGEGYWLWLDQPTTISYRGYARSSPLQISLATKGWYMLGGISQNKPITDLKVKNSAGTEFPWDQAKNVLIQDPIIGYNNAESGYISVGTQNSQTNQVWAWQGYWVYTFQDNLTLIVP